MDDEPHHTINIARRSCVEWFLWAFWLFLEVMFFQAAVASGRELEPRAATLYWLIFGVLLLGGATVWIIRRTRLL